MTDFDPAAWPRKLNLGCGFDRRQGYVNVDLHDFHHNGYTEMLLRDDLRVAGFDCVSFDSRDDWLFDVVAVKASQPKATRLADCRFMDLRRPSQVLAEPNSLAGLQARLRPTASRAKHLARGLRRRLDRLGRGDGADHDHRR